MDIVINRSLQVTEGMETCPHLQVGDKADFVVYAKESGTELPKKGYCKACYAELENVPKE